MKNSEDSPAFKSPNKCSYKITDWKDYNNSLKKRGKVNIWISAKLLSIWKDTVIHCDRCNKNICW